MYLRTCRKTVLGRDYVYWQLVEKLGLVGFLETVVDRGREEVPWSVLAMVLVVMRLVDPASE